MSIYEVTKAYNRAERELCCRLLAGGDPHIFCQPSPMQTFIEALLSDFAFDLETSKDGCQTFKVTFNCQMTAYRLSDCGQVTNTSSSSTNSGLVAEWWQINRWALADYWNHCLADMKWPEFEVPEAWGERPSDEEIIRLSDEARKRLVAHLEGRDDD